MVQIDGRNFFVTRNYDFETALKFLKMIRIPVLRASIAIFTCALVNVPNNVFFQAFQVFSEL